VALIRKVDLDKVVRKSINESAETILRKTAAEFSAAETYDIFLSHSYSDAGKILKVKTLLENMGFSTYVDWVDDRQLDRSRVTKKTAELLRVRLKSCKSLFFVTSDNSTNSKWMPWELGFFDALKGYVAILPILEDDRSTNTYEGQEYLGLYPYVTKDKPQGLDAETLWIRLTLDEYVRFDLWLKGTMPSKH